MTRDTNRRAGTIVLLMPDHHRRRLTLIGLALVERRCAGGEPRRSTAAGDDDGPSAAPDSADDGGDTDDGGSDGDEPEEPEGEFFRTDYEGLADPAGLRPAVPERHRRGSADVPRQPVAVVLRRRAGAPRRRPAILRQFPDAPMCKESTDLGVTKVWCGMGWTGQPTIVEREDRTWAIFGGYDGHLHFMDVATGERILPDVETGDLIKGTPTIDPEGYPLVYFGFTRQPPADRRPRPPRRRRGAVAARQRVRAAGEVERRLGLVADHHRRLHDRRQREQPLLGGEAQPLLRRRRAGAGGPRGRLHRRGVGRAGASRTTAATSTPRSRARSPSSTTSPTSAPRPGSCSATTSPASTTGDTPAAGVPLLHRRRQRRVARRRRRGLPLRRGPERPPGPPARAGGGPAAEARSVASPTNPIVWTFQETDGEGPGPLRHAGGARRHRVVTSAAAAGSSASTATPARSSGSARSAVRRGAAPWSWTTCS